MQQPFVILLFVLFRRSKRPFRRLRDPPPPCCTGEALHYGILASPARAGPVRGTRRSGERSEPIGALREQPFLYQRREVL